MIDRIVEGKKKKLNSKNTCNSKTVVDLDRENVLRAELDRVEQTPLTHTLIHTFCGKLNKVTILCVCKI